MRDSWFCQFSLIHSTSFIVYTFTEWIMSEQYFDAGLWLPKLSYMENGVPREKVGPSTYLWGFGQGDYQPSVSLAFSLKISHQIFVYCEPTSVRAFWYGKDRFYFSTRLTNAFYFILFLFFWIQFLVVVRIYSVPLCIIFFINENQNIC